MPSTPMPSAMTARANQNSTGPRRGAGTAGRVRPCVGGRRVGARPGTGRPAPVAGRRPVDGSSLRTAEQHDQRARPAPMIASGHGKPQPPTLSPTRASAASAADDHQGDRAAAGVEAHGGLVGAVVGHEQPARRRTGAGRRRRRRRARRATTRRMIGSMSRWRARPPATPAILRLPRRAAQPAEVAELVAGDARAAVVGASSGSVRGPSSVGAGRCRVHGSSVVARRRRAPSGRALILPHVGARGSGSPGSDRGSGRGRDPMGGRRRAV